MQDKLPLSIPSEDAGVIAHVFSDRSLMLSHAHFPFSPKLPSEEQVSYSRVCLLWSNDMLAREQSRAQSFPDQSCQRLLAKSGTVMFTLNPSTQETEMVRLCKFKASPVYRVSSWATQ